MIGMLLYLYLHAQWSQSPRIERYFVLLDIIRLKYKNHVQQQPSQTTALNIEKYRKAVNSALWVQVALVVCYVPKFIMLLVITYIKTYSSHVIVIDGITNILMYFNSTLNPFLYCWKVREVRQAVKQTIRRALCFPWT